MFLSNAFRYPDDVTALLLLELQITVEHAEVELLQKRVHVQTYLQQNRK